MAAELTFGMQQCDILCILLQSSPDALLQAALTCQPATQSDRATRRLNEMRETIKNAFMCLDCCSLPEKAFPASLVDRVPILEKNHQQSAADKVSS